MKTLHEKMALKQDQLKGLAQKLVKSEEENKKLKFSKSALKIENEWFK